MSRLRPKCPHVTKCSAAGLRATALKGHRKSPGACLTKKKSGISYSLNKPDICMKRDPISLIGSLLIVILEWIIRCFKINICDLDSKCFRYTFTICRICFVAVSDMAVLDLFGSALHFSCSVLE